MTAEYKFGSLPLGTIRVETRGQIFEYEILDSMIQPSGRYSEVYPAEETRSKKSCAIKIMIPEGSMLSGYHRNVKDRRKAFETETKILLALQKCKNVVDIYNHGVVAGSDRPVIIEELLETDKRLSDFNGVFSIEQAYSFSVQLSAMLAEAHSKGIVYRDFQRAHFFCDWNYNHFGKEILKVVDWNACKLGNPATLGIESEITEMREGLYNIKGFYPYDSEISRIVFMNKHASARGLLLELFRFGVRNNLPCPEVIPLKYKLLAWWLKARKGS